MADRNENRNACRACLEKGKCEIHEKCPERKLINRQKNKFPQAKSPYIINRAEANILCL
jgi:hypothetical protein